MLLVGRSGCLGHQRRDARGTIATRPRTAACPSSRFASRATTIAGTTRARSGSPNDIAVHNCDARSACPSGLRARRGGVTGSRSDAVDQRVRLGPDTISDIRLKRLMGTIDQVQDASGAISNPAPCHATAQTAPSVMSRRSRTPHAHQVPAACAAAELLAYQKSGRCSRQASGPKALALIESRGSSGRSRASVRRRLVGRGVVAANRGPRGERRLARRAPAAADHRCGRGLHEM